MLFLSLACYYGLWSSLRESALRGKKAVARMCSSFLSMDRSLEGGVAIKPLRTTLGATTFSNAPKSFERKVHMIMASESRTQPPIVTIKMSRREARILLQMTESVGGNPSGPRSVADRIRRSLLSAGLWPTKERCIGTIEFV